MKRKPQSAEVQRIREALREVDWPRAIHRVATFVRALRGDREIATDSNAEVKRAIKLRETVDRTISGG